MRLTARGCWLLWICVAASCGRIDYDAPPGVDASRPIDASTDAALDAPMDAALDAPMDAGTPCVPAPITTLTPGPGASWTGIAWSGGRAAVIYQSGGGDVRLVFFDRAGAMVGAPLDVETTGLTAERPSIALAGAGYLATWDEDSGGLHHVYAAELGADGALVGTPVDVSRSTASAWRSDILTEGGLPWVVWKDEEPGNVELRASSIALGSHALIAPIEITSSPSSSQQPALASGPSGIVVAYQENGAGDEVWLTTLDAPRVPLRLTATGEAGLAPDIAFNGRVHMVAYDRTSAPDAGTVVVPLPTSGAPAPAVLVSDPTGADPTDPAIAATPDGFAVAWTAGDEIFAVRVSDDGTPLAAPVHATAVGANRISVAWTGDGLAVAFDVTGGIGFAVLCL